MILYYTAYSVIGFSASPFLVLRTKSVSLLDILSLEVLEYL